MKKTITGIIVGLVLGIGGTFVATQTNDDQSKEFDEKERENNSIVEATSQDASRESDVEDESPQVEPTEEAERFEDIGGKQPWGVWYQPDIDKFLSEGKIVYLLKDGYELEKFLLSLTAKVGEVEGVEHEIKRMTDHLKSFIQDVGSRRTDKVDYINKMKEVDQAFENEEYDKIPTLIEEAKTLRESE